MVKEFCTYCGNPIESDDQFCFKCGSKLEPKKRTVTAQSEERSFPVRETETVRASSSSASNTAAQSVAKPKRKKRLKIIIPIIIGIILVPAITISTIASVRVPLGTLTYDIAAVEGISEAAIEITNDIGSIGVSYDSSIDGLFEAELDVKGRVGTSLEDAYNFQHTQTNDSFLITFDSSPGHQTGYAWDTLSYEIMIYLHPSVVVDFNLECTTGSVGISLEGNDDLVLKDVNLQSSTGSVAFATGSSSNLTVAALDLRTQTGSVSLIMDNAFESTLESVYLLSSTGSVSANLGEQTVLNETTVILSTSTGSVSLVYENLVQYGNIEWLLTTSTGSIDIATKQTMLPPTNCSSTFEATTSTGSIDVTCIYDSNIGLEFDASTDTGSIDLPEGRSYYATPDFALKNVQCFFILTTSTGSVSASINT